MTWLKYHKPFYHTVIKISYRISQYDWDIIFLKTIPFRYHMHVYEIVKILHFSLRRDHSSLFPFLFTVSWRWYHVHFYDSMRYLVPFCAIIKIANASSWQQKDLAHFFCEIIQISWCHYIIFSFFWTISERHHMHSEGIIKISFAFFKYHLDIMSLLTIPLRYHIFFFTT